MNPWKPTFCVTCFYYPIRDAVASDDGKARCPLYEDRRRWDNPATVLYARDPHVGARRAQIDELKTKFPSQEIDQND